MQRLFLLPQGVDFATLLRRLPLVAGKVQQAKEERIYLDTFDARVHGADWSLWQEGEKSSCLVLERSSHHETIALEGRRPIKAEHLGDSRAAKALARLIENRALLPMLDVQISTDRYPLLDQEGKRHLTLERATLTSDTTSTEERIVLVPMRGYEKSLVAVGHALLEAGCEPGGWPVARWLLECLPEHPKPFLLAPDEAAIEGFCRLLLHQIAVMDLNEAGVIRSDDVEFLHDFRVALRRMRSLLGRLKGVLSESCHEQLRQELSALGTQTGHVRDLDVWLEQLSEQKRHLPPELQGGLEPLIAHIKSEHKKTAKALNNTLESKTYQELKIGWKRLLTQPARSQLGPNAQSAIGDLAACELYKRIKRVLKDGGAINHESSDSKLHTLRIDCKKVRYLLEFFGHFFGSKTMRRMVKVLKRLQSTLGSFQDIATQRHNLTHALEKLRANNQQTPECLMASGALLAHLQESHERLRAQFFVEFEHFSNPGVAQAVLMELKTRKEAHEGDRTL